MTYLRTALLVAAIAIAGCGGGGGEKAATYKKETDAIGTEFKESVQNANTRIQAATDAEGKLEGLADMKQAVTKASNDYFELEPPSEIEADNDKLVEQLRSFAEDIGAVERAARGGNEEALRDGLVKIQRDAESIQATLERIEGKLAK